MCEVRVRVGVPDEVVGTFCAEGQTGMGPGTG